MAVQAYSTLSSTPPIAWLFGVTTVVIALNTVFFKRMMNCYRGDASISEPHDYAIFVSVFDIFLWAVLMSGLSLMSGGHLWGRSAKFSWASVLSIASIDQFGTLLATIGATQVSGQAQVLLNQAPLPLTLLMSASIGHQYSIGQYCGAMLVLAGAIVAAGLPTHLDLQRANVMSGAVSAFSLAQVAVAIAGLLKEHVMRQAQSTNKATKCDPIEDPIALGVAVAWARVPLGVAIALMMPGSFSDVLVEFIDGWRCFCGYAPRLGDAGCRSAAGITMTSVVLYAAQTLLGLRLTQCTSATLRSIAAVTAVPLAQWLFTSTLLMTREDAETYSHGAAVGVTLCLGGFSLYLRAESRAQLRVQKTNSPSSKSPYPDNLANGSACGA